MGFPSFNTILANIYKTYHSNPGKMLIHTGVIGWVMSSFAQIVAILVNDKIPKEQKMFLIPQEAADAAANILSFYLVTRSFTAIGNKLVKTGKWLPANVKNYLIKNNFGDKLGKLDFDISKIKLPYRIKRSYKLFDNGMDVAATTAGSILSCNIITPVLRNAYASHRQKQSIEKMNYYKNNPDDKMAIFYNRLAKAHDAYRGNLKI